MNNQILAQAAIPFVITNEMVNNYLDKQAPKKGRRVIWNSYAFGTYKKAVHGPIGTPKHQM